MKGLAKELRAVAKEIASRKIAGKVALSEMQKFVKANIEDLEEWDIRGVWEKIVSKKFQEDTDFYLSINGHRSMTVDSLGFSIKPDDITSYADILKKFQNFQKETGLNSNEMWEKKAFVYLVKSEYLRIVKKNEVKLGQYGKNTLVRLLDYIINGTKTNDLAKANKICDDNGIGLSADFPFKPIKGLNPLKMKIFKNGKVAFKGLTDNQWNNIVRIHQLCGGR